VQIVRPGEAREHPVEQPELFMLIDDDTNALVSFDRLASHLLWSQPDLLWVRLRTPGASAQEPGRVALTSSRKLARFWGHAVSGAKGWKSLREAAKDNTHKAIWTWGRSFRASMDSENQEMAMALLNSWRWPDTGINGIREQHKGIWSQENVQLNPAARIASPTWIGIDRNPGPGEQIDKPAILWDHPSRNSPAD
jgi:hypothetical protein